MLLYHLPPREVSWHTDPASMEMPFQFEMHVVLTPPELFGTADFTDSMRTFPANEDGVQNIRYSGSLFAGADRISTTSPVRFPSFNFEGKFAGADIRIDGNVATIKGECGNLYSLYWLVQTIIERLPASFSCVTTTPVSISEIRGRASEHEFTVKLKDEFYRDAAFTISTDFHEKIKQNLGEILLNTSDLPIQIVAAMRYLSQSFLLESVSKYNYQFASERMLNVSKALDSLTHEAGDSVEKMRQLLKHWGVHEGYIAIFASIKYLRNQLDIAHMSYSQISAEAHLAIQEFLPVAEKCTQSLILTAIRIFKNDRNSFKKHTENNEDPVVIKKLANYRGISLNNIGSLETFLES